MTSAGAQAGMRPAVAGTSRAKLCTLDEMAAIVAQLRRDGRTVVHCHGAFDLLHLGHVRHLEAARRLGDVLIVTLTADRFLTKGPGRPVFNQELRAEMLAAVLHVDWVAINHAPDAESAITKLRANLYVKGREYEDAERDITGKIVDERQAIERCGGRLVFTDEATFSSTELINRHLDVLEPDVREYLDAARANGGLQDVVALIDKVRNYRVLVLGDAIIDEYQYVHPMGKTAKESVIAARYDDREVFAGGVFAVANHVASLCRQVDVISCLGAVDSHEKLVRATLRPNVRLQAFERPGAPTTIKRRFVDPSCVRKLFEVYVIDDQPLGGALQTEVDGAIAASLGDYDVVIVTDFGHGLLGPSSIEILTSGSAPFLAVNAQSNTANFGYNLITKYPRADYICIDALEARLAIGDRLSPLADVSARLLDGYVNCPRVIVTHGSHGCVVYERGACAHAVPAFATSVVDTVGAGDAFLAVTAPLVAAGGSLEQIGLIGNVAAALMVDVVGHRRSIEKPALLKSLGGLLR